MSGHVANVSANKNNNKQNKTKPESVTPSPIGCELSYLIRLNKDKISIPWDLTQILQIPLMAFIFLEYQKVNIGLFKVGNGFSCILCC